MWIRNFFRVIKFNGGFKQTFLQLFRTDDVKFGRYVGRDQMGNNYYENNYYFYCRNRWVLYSNRYGYDYEGSLIHPEWFRWMHQTTDLLPHNETNRVRYRWMLPYEENQTGTNNRFVPYSTTKPKIIPWIPPKSKKDNSKCLIIK